MKILFDEQQQQQQYQYQANKWEVINRYMKAKWKLEDELLIYINFIKYWKNNKIKNNK